LEIHIFGDIFIFQSALQESSVGLFSSYLCSNIEF